MSCPSGPLLPKLAFAAAIVPAQTAAAIPVRAQEQPSQAAGERKKGNDLKGRKGEGRKESFFSQLWGEGAYGSARGVQSGYRY